MSVNYKEAKSIYCFTVNDLDGQPVSLQKYEGNVCIIVNIASECVMAKTNFDELNQLHEAYSETKGLKILAFPCNQFAETEPGDNSKIKHYIRTKSIKFEVFEKIRVNGSDGSPLWKYLKMKQPGTFGGFIKWNFTKFIVDKNGQVVERFGPNTDPIEMLETIQKYLYK